MDMSTEPELSVSEVWSLSPGSLVTVQEGTETAEYVLGVSAQGDRFLLPVEEREDATSAIPITVNQVNSGEFVVKTQSTRARMCKNCGAPIMKTETKEILLVHAKSELRLCPSGETEAEPLL